MAVAKRIQNVKTLPSVEKRYTPVVYSLFTYYIRSIHLASMQCDFISAVYYVNLQHIRATKGSCPFSFDKRLRCPFCFLLASAQLTSAGSENGKREENKVHERPDIVSSTDIERCKRMHPVIKVCPCVYVRHT